MPRIFDNIDLNLLPAMRTTLEVAERSDFCVGYFNLRDWKAIDDLVDRWAGGTGMQCTEEELDFLVNYEIKYRMGRDADYDEGVES